MSFSNYINRPLNDDEMDMDALFNNNVPSTSLNPASNNNNSITHPNFSFPNNNNNNNSNYFLNNNNYSIPSPLPLSLSRTPRTRRLSPRSAGRLF